MSKEPGDSHGDHAAGLHVGFEAELSKAARDFMEQVGAGGLDNAEILSLVAKAVSPLTQRSNPSRVLRAVYATITLEEFLTLKMLFEDQMTVEQIAQRQDRPVETVQAEIAPAVPGFACISSPIRPVSELSAAICEIRGHPVSRRRVSS